MKRILKVQENMTSLLNVKVPWVRINPAERKPVSCLLCGSDDPEKMFSIMINEQEFHIVRCKHDNLIWLNPQPGPTFLNTLYTEEYYRVKKPELLLQVGIKDSTKEDQVYRQEIARRQVEEWNKIGITGRLLEIGGGKGYLQQAAAEKGWNTFGLEVSQTGVKSNSEKGLKSLYGSIENLKNKYSGYFDLIAMYAVIEHFTDPFEILSSLKDILADGGYLAIRTPNTDERKGPRLHLVDHLWHFSEHTLTALLDKAGFEVTTIFESGIFPPGTTSSDRIVGMTLFAKKRSNGNT
jgi:SAM-dependent methyltransferase